MKIAARDFLIRELPNISGSEILKRVSEYHLPSELIQGLSRQDFFWMVMKVGEEDCIPLLKMATTEQWQFMLDLKIWERDRVNFDITTEWLMRFLYADPVRFVRWLLTEAQQLAFNYFHIILKVEMVTEDSRFDADRGFFTLDGVFHLAVLKERYEEKIELLVRSMERHEPIKSRYFLEALSCVIPAEIEEEMYRMRGTRLAEDGFLPFDEALDVYSPIAADIITGNVQGENIFFKDQADVHEVVSLIPLEAGGNKGLFMKALSLISDPQEMDRIGLEFAGLCNQILSADNGEISSFDDLVAACRKAEGYINCILEKLSSEDVSVTANLISANSLAALFRAGYGLVSDVKKRYRKVLAETWFLRRGLSYDFWGDEWSMVLNGLFRERPLFNGGYGEGLRDFESYEDILKTEEVLDKLLMLDSLVENMVEEYKIDRLSPLVENITYRALIFTCWARELMGVGGEISPLLPEQVKKLFRKIRGGQEKPPYDMKESREDFFLYMKRYCKEMGKGLEFLERVLAELWADFYEEYKGVDTEDMEGRYLSYFIVSSVS